MGDVSISRPVLSFSAQERVAGALANMANHEATSYVMVHGECLDVLNRLLRTSAHEGLHEQVNLEPESYLLGRT